MMAVASWMLRHRNLHSNRYNRGRLENDEDNVKIDLSKDPEENAREILTNICAKAGLTEGRRLNYLNAYVKLLLHIEGNVALLGFSVDEILCCLRVALVSDLTQIRSGGLRAVRHTIQTTEDVILLKKLQYPSLIARSLDLALKNDIERVQALRLMRKVLLLCSGQFDIAMARSLVSLANGGAEEKDRMLRACLATLSELGVLNPELFILSGGVAAITRNLLECQTPRIAESLCGVLLLLLDRPVTRNRAAVDLHCVAAPYCDFHYRHGWMDKNRDERELRFNCSRLALLSILRSWPGILHFCSPNNMSGLRAIVDILYLNQLEVRKAVLDLLYELLGLPQPEWTDELSVALSAVDPSEPQASWRVGEGFVAAEGRSILPHLARTTPSIADMHLALLLYCFLEAGLLGALGEVIATSDTFISVRATVLLGELMHLIQILLPPECCNITPALPNLLTHAITNHHQALTAITALQQLHRLLKRRPASSSLYLDHILQCGTYFKCSAAVETRKYKMSTSGRRKIIYQLVNKEGEDILKETGVLQLKDGFSWNWSIIKAVLKGECDFQLDLNESTHRTFLTNLIYFYLPSKNRYSHMDLTNPKNTHGYTSVGCELINCLLGIREGSKLLLELFTDICHQVSAITTSRSAHDCLFSPQHMANTLCQTYFLFIGYLGHTQIGIDILTQIGLLKKLQDLATTTNHDCYVKLIVSSLDYRKPGPARDLLAAVLTCQIESSRLYATQFLLVLLRAGIVNFEVWGVKLLAGQLADSSKLISLVALTILHEACESSIYLDGLIQLNPKLLHLGDKGLLLLIRFMSRPAGFNLLKKKNFVTNEIKRWDEHFNYKYVRIVEGETADALTLHQHGEDGRYDKRTSSLRATSRRDLYLPAHIYGQLAKHSVGHQMLTEHGSVENLIKCIEVAQCETEDDILRLKGALWALGHLGSSPKGVDTLNTRNVLKAMVRLSQHCVVYSVRATAFYALGLVGTTRSGADALFTLGWVSVRHDRHERWPIIEEENWSEEQTSDSVFHMELGSDSERTSSDQVFTGDFYLADADSSTTDDDFILGGVGGDAQQLTQHQQKSSTLPGNQNTSSSKHKRSLSESKTFEYLKPQDYQQKVMLQREMAQENSNRRRNNSCTESTTSGVSSCDSVLGKSAAINDHIQTLSPIPSSSSLSTLKTTGIKIRRNSESIRRISMHSAASQPGTPSENSTVSPAGSGRFSHQDLLGYATLRSLRRQQRSLYSKIFSGGGDDGGSSGFGTENTLIGSQSLRIKSLDRQRSSQLGSHPDEEEIVRNCMFGASLTSLSSVQKFNTKQQAGKDQGQCYMGISLPRKLADLFPEVGVMMRRPSYSEYFLEDEDAELEEDLDISLSRSSRYSSHDTRNCLLCCRKQWKNRYKQLSSADNSVPSTSDGSSQGVDELRLKVDILKHIERIANPVWSKQSKQALLQHKQKMPSLFQDVCLYSEVLKMVSTMTYRLSARRFLQELFYDLCYAEFYNEPHEILERTKDRRRVGAGTQMRRSGSEGVCDDIAAMSRSAADSDWTDSDFVKCSYFNSHQRNAELSELHDLQDSCLSASSSSAQLPSGYTQSTPLKISKAITRGFSIDSEGTVSPPSVLWSVKEENVASIENLLKVEQNENKSEDGQTRKVNVPNTTKQTYKTIDSLKLTCSENKFPIKHALWPTVENKTSSSVPISKSSDM